MSYGVLCLSALAAYYGETPARGNMTDAALACGSEIMRIINDSLGIENQGRRLIGEK